jgi:DNA-directed RNA polymerase specialized sigma54-like protein
MVTLGTYLVAEPRLQQSVSPQLILQSQLLELSADDLLDRIRAELEANPALEVVEDTFHFPPYPPVHFPTYEAPDVLDQLSTPLGADLVVKDNLAEVAEPPRG